MGQGSRLSGGTKAGGPAGTARSFQAAAPLVTGVNGPLQSLAHTHVLGQAIVFMQLRTHVYMRWSLGRAGGSLWPPSHRWEVAWNDPSPQGNAQREATPQRERRAYFGNEHWAAKNTQTCTVPALDHELARDRNAHETVSPILSSELSFLCRK